METFRTLRIFSGAYEAVKHDRGFKDIWLCDQTRKVVFGDWADIMDWPGSAPYQTWRELSQRDLENMAHTFPH